MLTLNQIKHKLKDYMNAHAQINEVVWGDDFTFASDRDINFPAAHLTFLESNVNGKLLNHTYQIALTDLIAIHNPESSDEVLSDMMLIADDFMAWLQEQNDFQFTKSSQILKLNDAYGDRLAGVRFRITLSTIRRQADCMTPTKKLTKPYE